ncbi:ead/Ea22-like family protein [Enterobacter quasihormaechei]|uniref:ead/Ea22-like family protein n=1 Tax=Enterobacter quasihormaechei TaxID=2529382 RepID=UPI002FD33BA7
MSNIDKQAVQAVADLKAGYTLGHTDVEIIQQMALDAVALLDELEAKDKINAELMEKQRLIDICQGQGLEHRIAAEKRAEAAEKKTVEMPTFDGYVPHVARELQAAFRIACDNAGINVAAAGKGE